MLSSNQITIAKFDASKTNNVNLSLHKTRHTNALFFNSTVPFVMKLLQAFKKTTE